MHRQLHLQREIEGLKLKRDERSAEDLAGLKLGTIEIIGECCLIKNSALLRWDLIFGLTPPLPKCEISPLTGYVAIAEKFLVSEGKAPRTRSGRRKDGGRVTLPASAGPLLARSMR